MTPRASCADCTWELQDDDLEVVGDAAEAHERKEAGHEVNIERDVATDGGSKYVNPTGEGYLGVATVRRHSLPLCIGTWPVDWEVGATVSFIEASPGVALVAGQDADAVGHTTVSNFGSGSRRVCVSGQALAELGVENGDDVRAYERDAESVLLVPAAGDPMLATDGGEHACEGCDETFETLTSLRLHEKDDCQARATYDELDPDSDDVGLEAAEGLLTCRVCGAENPDADLEETPSYDGEDYHLIVEFACQHCGSENENRVVLTTVDEDDLQDLPPHLQPDDGTMVTDGGSSDIGNLHAATVLEVDGQAVLAIKGTDGSAQFAVPEGMVTPLEDTVDEVGRVYTGETDGTLIGDGGRDLSMQAAFDGDREFLPASVVECLETHGLGTDDLDPQLGGLRCNVPREGLPAFVRAVLEGVDGRVEIETEATDAYGLDFRVEWHRIHTDVQDDESERDLIADGCARETRTLRDATDLEYRTRDLESRVTYLEEEQEELCAEIDALQSAIDGDLLPGEELSDRLERCDCGPLFDATVTGHCPECRDADGGHEVIDDD